jgi:hypothetical protein
MSGCSCIDIFVLPIGLPDIDDTAYRDALIHTIKLHVQIFLRMNTWMIETCRRQYNWIKSLVIKLCILLVLITQNFRLCLLMLHHLQNRQVSGTACPINIISRPSKICVTIDGKSTYYSTGGNLLWCVRCRKARSLYGHLTVYLSSCRNLPL